MSSDASTVPLPSVAVNSSRIALVLEVADAIEAAGMPSLAAGLRRHPERESLPQLATWLGRERDDMPDGLIGRLRAAASAEWLRGVEATYGVGAP